MFLIYSVYINNLTIQVHLCSGVDRINKLLVKAWTSCRSHGLFRIVIRQIHLQQIGHDFFYEICNFRFICHTLELLQYSKHDPRELPRLYFHFYLLKVVFWCFEIISDVEKVAKCTPYLQWFQVQRYLFYIFILNNAIYIYVGSPWSTSYTSCCGLYFYKFLVKTKYSDSINMMLHHEKLKTWQPIIGSVWWHLI